MTQARTILLVEDNLDVTAVLRAELTDEGFHVLHAADGHGGLHLVRTASPDLVVLDLGLPDLPGQEVLVQIRKESRIPVVILTAHGTPNERPQLLSLGANDYLLKPFHSPELIARIRAQLEPSEAPIRTVGTFTLDPGRRVVGADGREFVLSEQEFTVAMFLASQPGRVYSRSEIGAALGADGEVELDELLGQLRRKLRCSQGRAGLKEVRGLGFALRT